MNPARRRINQNPPSLLNIQRCLLPWIFATSRFKALACRAKDGRVLSGGNRKRIEEAVASLDGARTALVISWRQPNRKQADSHSETRRLYLEWRATRQRVAQLGTL